MLLLLRVLVVLLSFSSTSSSVPLSHCLAPQQSWYIKARNTIVEAVWGIPHASPSVGISEQCRGPRFGPSYDLASYGDDIVLRFRLQSPGDATALTQAARILFLDTWQITPSWADIRLSKDVVPALLGLLPSTMHHAHTPLMHDLAQVVRESYPPSISTRPYHLLDRPSRVSSLQQQPLMKATNIFFGEYQPLSVIDNWMRLLQSLFPTHVRLIRIGTSYEGRDIQALRVGVRASSDRERRKTIVISGGSHAREWISTSTVNYIAYIFITEYGKSKDVTNLLQKFDFVFIPSLNPDGYVYTFEHDRLWRKNRQNTSLPFCTGLDLERAYGFQWSGDLSKENPCSESFAGGAPFEAKEARQFANWARNETESNDHSLVGFLDLHSYSQQVLYPYAFSCTSAPPSLENLEELAIGLAKAIRTTNGENYGVTSACEGSVPDPVDQGSMASADDPDQAKELRYQKGTGGGSALDWFYHELKVPYTYQLKLRDTGSYGFLLPSENIVPTGKEAFKAVEYLGNFIAGRKDIEEFT